MKTKTKITAAIVLTALVSGTVFSGLSYYQSRQVVSHSAFADLEALRDAKSAEIEEFFEKKTRAADSLSHDIIVATAMTDLQAAYRNINQGGETVLADVSSNVRDYYERHALPPIAKSLGVLNAPYDTYGPKTRAARHLQNIFNVQPKSSKSPRQKSYEALHGLYDDKLKSMAAVNGFADLLLIDTAQGDVIYSAQKGIDFGTNVYNGAFANSVLGLIVDEVRNTPSLHISDIELYAPAHSEASAFVAVPVYDQNIPIGIMALRLKAEQVSALSAFGLTERGDRDVYLAGGDYLMRSNAPFAQANLNAYVRLFKDAGGADDVARKIKLGRSTILAQSVESEAVSAALSGKSGATVAQNYLGNSVLSAYAPINIGENDWVILAERNAVDVYAPFRVFTQRLAIAAAVFVPFLLLLALWMASRLMRPARAMMEAARAIADGENSAFTEDNSEWGRIGSELNKVVDLDPWQISTSRRKIVRKKPIKLISIETSKRREAKVPVETVIETPAPKKIKNKLATIESEKVTKLSTKDNPILKVMPPIAASVPKVPVDLTPPEVKEIIESVKAPEEAQVEMLTRVPKETIDEPVVKVPAKAVQKPAPITRPEPKAKSIIPKSTRPKRAARSDAGIKNGVSSDRVMAPRARRKTLPPMSSAVNKPLKVDIVPPTDMREPLVLTQAVAAEMPKRSEPVKTVEPAIPPEPTKSSEHAKPPDPEVMPLSDTPRRFRRRRRR